MSSVGIYALIYVNPTWINNIFNNLCIIFVNPMWINNICISMTRVRVLKASAHGDGPLVIEVCEKTIEQKNGSKSSRD